VIKNIIPVIIQSPWTGELNAQKGVASALVADLSKHIIVPDDFWKTELEKQFKAAKGNQVQRLASWKICFENAQQVIRKHCRSISPDYDIPVIVNIGGRDSSAFLSLASKSLFSNSFLMNIQYPKLASAWYDLLALPPVELPQETTAKTMRIGSVPNLVSESLMQKAREVWSPILSAGNRKTLAIIVGGYTGVAGVGSGIREFTLKHGQELIQAVMQIQEQTNCNLLLTTSRRTPANVGDLLRTQLAPRCLRSYFATDSSPNPLMGYMACADAFVVTAESMSMISEAADTGKPVHTYMPEGILSSEHEIFYNAMRENGHITPLPSQIHFGVGRPIHAAASIAEIITHMIGGRERSPQSVSKIASGECAL
jgi:mitochondrial fission protein ELM1